MGDRIYRSCSARACPAPGTVRGRCSVHAGELEADRNRERETDLKVYRSARWKRLRARILRARPWCEDASGCHEPATDVDHVLALARGGDPWDEANLRPLCHAHHSRKTQREDRRRVEHRESARPEPGPRVLRVRDEDPGRAERRKVGDDDGA